MLTTSQPQPHDSWQCPTCGDLRATGYCPECGERRPHGHDLTLAGLFEQAIEAFTHADGRFVSTYWRLMASFS